MSLLELSYRTEDLIDGLFVDGPLLDVVLTAPQPLMQFLHDNDLPPFPTMSGLALIDTGAAVSAVDESVMEQLEIPPVESCLTQTAHGLADLRMYNATAQLPQLQMASVPLRLALGGHVRTPTLNGKDVVMLIGRDLLRRFVVTYDGLSSRLSITY